MCDIYENNPMNRFNQFIKYRGHIERLYLSKSFINDKCPIIPSFFQKRRKNAGIEANYRLYNDNYSLRKRLISIINSNSPYCISEKKPAKCPAFERKEKIRIKKYKSIIKENNSFYKIIQNTKSTLDHTKIRNDYLKTRYYKYNICKNKVSSNPNLKFVSFGKFNKKCNNLIKETFINNKLNKSYRLRKNMLGNDKLTMNLSFPYLDTKAYTYIQN